MQGFNMESLRNQQAAINEALAATREYGLPISNALDDAWTRVLAVRDTEKGLDILKAVWNDAQPSLAVINAAHPGAMQYFVDIKDGIKKRILNGTWD